MPSGLLEDYEAGRSADCCAAEKALHALPDAAKSIEHRTGQTEHTGDYNIWYGKFLGEHWRREGPGGKQAAETRCVSVALGQMTPVGSKGGPTVGKSAGQSRKTSSTQESAMYRIAGGWPAARSADAVEAAEPRKDG